MKCDVSLQLELLVTALFEGCWSYAKVLLQFLIILLKPYLLYPISLQKVDVLGRSKNTSAASGNNE